MTLRRWGKTKIKAHVGEFFKSLTWMEIMSRLENKTPLIFIIMKKSGEIHNIIIKSGETPQTLTVDDFKSIKALNVEPKIKKEMDKILKADLVALHPAPIIEGIEPKKKEPKIEEPLETHPFDLPKEEQQKLAEAVPIAAPAVTLDPTPAVKEFVPEEIAPLADGEVDLQAGMKIIFDDNGTDREAVILDLFEEEGQLLINQPGTKKKDIIDASRIRRLA